MIHPQSHPMATHHRRSASARPCSVHRPHNDPPRRHAPQNMTPYEPTTGNTAHTTTNTKVSYPPPPCRILLAIATLQHTLGQTEARITPQYTTLPTTTQTGKKQSRPRPRSSEGRSWIGRKWIRRKPAQSAQFQPCIWRGRAESETAVVTSYMQ